jgi:hypothetical protein
MQLGIAVQAAQARSAVVVHAAVWYCPAGHAVLHAVQVMPLPKYPLLHVQTALPVDVSQSAFALQTLQPGGIARSPELMLMSPAPPRSGAGPLEQANRNTATEATTRELRVKVMLQYRQPFEGADATFFRIDTELLPRLCHVVPHRRSCIRISTEF